MVVDVLSENLPPSLRNLIEEYKELHFNYKCEEAVELGKEAYRRFTKKLDNQK